MQLISNNEVIDVQWLTFSDSAITCRVDPDAVIEKYISIDVTDETNNIPLMKEKMEMLYYAIYDTFDMDNIQEILVLGYLPYARADRIFQTGNTEPLRVFQDWLSRFNFDEIHINDPHNEQALDHHYLNYVINTQATCLRETLKKSHIQMADYDYIVSPDAGAVTKIQKISEMSGVPVLYALKKRNLETGRIESVELNCKSHADLVKSKRRVLIVDDILDGGGTFIPLAVKLKEMGYEVDLYVTHLIAAKGLEIFKDHIDAIYTHNIIADYVTEKSLNTYNDDQRIKNKMSKIQ